MKCSLGISNFLEEISSLSHSVVFLYFFALIAEQGFLVSPCYSLELCPVVDVTGDRSKDWCCKEQYCIGTWNVRSMNQGKLEVVKQEMLRVNTDILGISKLKWTGMGEFNSDDHCIYYCGQESLRRDRVALTVSKRVWNSVLGCNLKNDRTISAHFQGKPFNIAVIHAYAPTSNTEEAEVEWFYEDLKTF